VRYPPGALFADLYELTMIQGYFRAGMHRRTACFELFFRANPFGGGYAVAAGLHDALDFLARLHFPDEDRHYLRGRGLFGDDFLSYLKDFRFTGDVDALPEGTPVFPLEPVMRVTGPLDECQVVETALLNIINFQTLVATKAARIRHAAGADNILEFGMRRAQGPDGAMAASRAAFIGGCAATSNVQAGRSFGIPTKGTNAHSWIMAHETELEAFREYAQLYPHHSVFLVDTYDTLGSGVPNAIRVGLEMKSRGHKLAGIRLDSGDIAGLSIKSRSILDQAGLEYVKIFASGDLDEYRIEELRKNGACVDVWGVGTRLVTAHDDPSLTGVYKLCAIRSDDGEWTPRRKVSDEAGKSTLPGRKQIMRLYGSRGDPVADWMEIEDALPSSIPVKEAILKDIENRRLISDFDSAAPMLRAFLRGGRLVGEFPDLPGIRENARSSIEKLSSNLKTLHQPEEYKVMFGPALRKFDRKSI
jgi:nicotinate phosphoribosyltransferase